MSLNKQKGNMFSFVTHTWNPIRGRCPYGCEYCYVKNLDQHYIPAQPMLCLNNKESLTHGKKIFIGSVIDMWAEDKEKIPDEWLRKVLHHTWKYENEYFFCTKNPRRYIDFIKYFPEPTTLGITIESDRTYKGSDAPTAIHRFDDIKKLREQWFKDIFVSIEPIMNFNLTRLLKWMVDINPAFIVIGANSNADIELKEPKGKHIAMLVYELREKGFKVKLKKNLRRLFDYEKMDLQR